MIIIAIMVVIRFCSRCLCCSFQYCYLPIFI